MFFLLEDMDLDNDGFVEKDPTGRYVRSDEIFLEEEQSRLYIGLLMKLMELK